MMVRILCIGIGGLLWAAGAATAQPIDALRRLSTSPAAATFEELQRSGTPGEMVYVVDLAGRETRGRVVMLSQGSITVDADGARQRLAAADVVRIDRRRKDPVLNGVLIGAGAGALAGYGLGKSMDSPNCSGAVECGQGAMVGAVGGAVWGAVGGWLADALIRKRETIYLAPGSK
jgi:hypothetical protein